MLTSAPVLAAMSEVAQGLDDEIQRLGELCCPRLWQISPFSTALRLEACGMTEDTDI